MICTQSLSWLTHLDDWFMASCQAVSPSSRTGYQQSSLAVIELELDDWYLSPSWVTPLDDFTKLGHPAE
jgi:hypothetical protein